MKATAHHLLANEAASAYDADHAGHALDNSNPDAALLVNEVAVDERGWAVIPFGDWPHEAGMQHFHRPEAEAIANNFNTISGKVRRAICGLPIFKGHPDVPSLANQYPDKEEKGQIAEMEVRPNGLALKMVLSSAGANLVRQGWKFISPTWICNLLSKPGDALRRYAPAELRSVGLVVRPNIPSPSLANAANKAANLNHHKKMNPETLKLLGLAAEATPEQIDTAVKALHTNAGQLANEQTAHTEAKGKVTALEAKVVTLENAATKAATDLTDARTALANERKARIGGLLDIAIRQGRITTAERGVWEGRLVANFYTEATALANAAPKVKTESEIPAMLKQLEQQMRSGLPALPNGKSDADVGKENTLGKDACGFCNEDYQGMEPAKRSELRKGALANAEKALPPTLQGQSRRDRAFANAKKANPALFGFQPEPATA